MRGEARMHSLGATLTNGALGVSVYDYLSGRHWSVNGDRWFHAASVMKIAVLAALFAAVERGRFTLDCRLHVRNRFLSMVDGAPFRVDAGRDGDADVHAAIGRTMRVRELATQMIVRSSNLATNLLLDLLTPSGVMENAREGWCRRHRRAPWRGGRPRLRAGHQQSCDARWRRGAPARDRRRTVRLDQRVGRDDRHPARSTVHGHD
jgi:hypothetical protein